MKCMCLSEMDTEEFFIRHVIPGQIVQVAGPLDADQKIRGWYDAVVENVLPEFKVRVRIRYGEFLVRSRFLDIERFLVKQEDCVRRCLYPPEGYWRLKPSQESNDSEALHKLESGTVVSFREEANPYFSYDAVITGHCLEEDGMMYNCSMKDSAAYFEAKIHVSAINLLQSFVFAKRTVQSVRSKVKEQIALRSRQQAARLQMNINQIDNSLGVTPSFKQQSRIFNDLTHHHTSGSIENIHFGNETNNEQRSQCVISLDDMHLTSPAASPPPSNFPVLLASSTSQNGNVGKLNVLGGFEVYEINDENENFHENGKVRNGDSTGPYEEEISDGNDSQISIIIVHNNNADLDNLNNTPKQTRNRKPRLGNLRNQEEEIKNSESTVFSSKKPSLLLRFN